MREHKYKVWDEKNKEMYGPYTMEECMLGKFPMTFLKSTYHPDGSRTIYDGILRIDDLIFLQYIGLKDKNEREAYEGEIFKYSRSGRMFLIYWNEEFTKFCARYIHDDPGTFDDLWRYELDMAEYIGDIYQNPELLDKIDMYSSIMT